jgi:hypothetical protein
VEQGIDYGDQAIKLAERELAAAQVLVAGRCRAFERSEVARAQSLLTCAYQAVGSAKTLLGAAWSRSPSWWSGLAMVWKTKEMKKRYRAK